MLRKLPIDTYMLLLIGTVALATVLPVYGQAAVIVSKISYAAVSLLFFLYGAKLKTQAVWEGVSNWRLQAVIFVVTYVVFPVLGWLFFKGLEGVLPDDLRVGILFLTVLPSTVQSSIALTALARGNVPAAICAASLSNIVGVIITPLLAAWLLSASSVELHASSILLICVQLLLPFVAGQLMRPLIGNWVEKNKALTLIVDRGSILLIVYSAFSAGAVSGIWGKLDGVTLWTLAAADIGLLLLVMLIISFTGKLLNLPEPDRVTYLFCGAQKSLASGVPIASILFVGHSTSLIILPLMLYHQLQLLLSVVIAQRKASQSAAQEMAA